MRHLIVVASACVQWVACGGIASEDPRGDDEPPPVAVELDAGTPDAAPGAETLLVRFSTDLAPLEPGCDGVTHSTGAACNVAVDAWCRNRGPTLTGFGPVEYAGDAAHVTCVAAARQWTTFARLAAVQGACTVANPASLACNSAVQRFCVVEGFAAGFGVIGHVGDEVLVACSSSAAVELTSYAELVQHHAGCDGTTVAQGGACNAAVRRLCIARGAASGFGPVERNPAGPVSVICVR